MLMMQTMLFCFTNISADIFLQISGYSICAKHHILLHSSQMLLTLKALKIIGTKAALLLHQKCRSN
jgi:hypothetical protein